MKSFVKNNQARLRCLIAMVFVANALPFAETVKSLSNDCIGNVCIYHNEFFEMELLYKYGRGKEIIIGNGKHISKRSHCYYDAHQKLWVRMEASGSGDTKFTVQTIFVSYLPLCNDTVNPLNDFKPLHIKNISLGSKESLVVAVCGKPDRIDTIHVPDSNRLSEDMVPGLNPKFGSRKLVYTPEGKASLLFHAFYVENGRVVAMEISCAEQ